MVLILDDDSKIGAHVTALGFFLLSQISAHS